MDTIIRKQTEETKIIYETNSKKMKPYQRKENI